LQLIEQTGAAVRFLPAYSPDLNPIEKMWSKVKQFLRSAEARTRRGTPASHCRRPGLRHRPRCHQLVRLVWLQFHLICSNSFADEVQRDVA
jgi:transposase